MASRRFHLRAPGVKTGSRIGPLGPFRGTLGISWVVASIAVGLVLFLAGTWFFVRSSTPTEPFVAVGAVDSFPPGEARKVLDKVFVGRTEDGRTHAVAQPADNCPLEFGEGRYVDCLGLRYDLDGTPVGRGDPLALLPVELHGGDVYVDPTGHAGPS